MDTEHALLTTIAHNFHDDTPHLIYADWLDENENPAAASLIRKSITSRSSTTPDYNSGVSPHLNVNSLAGMCDAHQINPTPHSKLGVSLWKLGGGSGIRIGMHVHPQDHEQSSTFWYDSFFPTRFGELFSGVDSLPEQQRQSVRSVLLDNYKLKDIRRTQYPQELDSAYGERQ